MAPDPDPPTAERIERQQPTGNGSGKGGRWLARERRLSQGDDKGEQREHAVDDRAGGWKKDWTGNDEAMVTVAVAALATADVTAAVVATETAMLRRRW
jgi:hypothetical protein